MKLWDRRYGIRKKYLRYTLVLLFVALALSCIGVWQYWRQNLTKTVVNKYEFMTEKMGISLDNLFKKSDEVTAECIMYADVQRSLGAQPIEEREKRALSKYFDYINMEHVAEYCYVDNKENVYVHSYSKVSYEQFRYSGFEKLLGDSYAKTRWIWTKDTLFGTNEYALFIGRYVHSFEYAHEPGMLFLKMDEKFLEEVVPDSDMQTEKIVVGILDTEGKKSMSWGEDNYEIGEKDEKMMREMTKTNVAGMIARGKKMADGILFAYCQKESGLVVFTFVPDVVLTAGLEQIFLVMLGIYLLVMIIAVVFSIYFSKRFAQPIKDISEAMSSFDGRHFDNTIQMNTNTELDQIGQSYNKMLENIQRLLEEIKNQERELRQSELNLLISQINPHFLYNTLDTIYMLARINGEQTTMKMIQALSRYLRLSLSKGQDLVTVEDELENVKSHMEIQQIRNENLFQYEVDCQVDLKHTWILKLTLQPLVENAIKYGFCEIYEGGLIQICIWEKDHKLMVAVFNSGHPIEPEIAEKVNRLNGKPLMEVKGCFPDKQHGYGVVNVITRLRLKYGEDVRFSYEAKKNGTKCIIEFPDNGKKNREL